MSARAAEAVEPLAGLPATMQHPEGLEDADGVFPGEGAPAALPPGASAPAPTVARQGLLVILNNVVGAVAGFAALFVVARYMGDAVLGSRAYALALVSLVGILARLGLPTTHVRRLARGHDPAAATGTFAALKAGLTLLFMLAAGGAAWLWSGLLGRGVSDTTPDALVLAYWIVVVQSLRDIPVATFQGLRLLVEREAVLLANTVGTVLLTAAVGVAYAHSHGRWTPWPEAGETVARLLGVGPPLDPLQAITLLVAAVLVAECAALALAAALFVRRRLRIGRPARPLVRTYLAFTLPLMLLAFGEVAGKWLSQVLLGFWWDAAELGQFAAASKLAEVFLLLGASLGVVLLPAISSLHKRGADDDALRLTEKAERWISLLLWPVLLVVVLLQAPLVHILLSDRFQRSGPVLAVLAFQTLLASLLVPAQALAIGTGRPRFAAQVVLATVLASAGLSLLLVPQPSGAWPGLGMGAQGAALASLGATALALLLYRVPHGGWPGHRFLRRSLVVHALAAAATWLLFRWVQPPAPERFPALLVHAAAIAAMYGALLLLARELHGGDWRDLKRLLGLAPAEAA